MSASFQIIAGSYERLLYGIDATFVKSQDDAETETLSLVPTFIYPAHITCIKCAAATGRFLATGSTDEHVKLYDLTLRKEVGSLMHHTGSITALSFFAKSHLITASEDGNIGIVRTSDWELLKLLTGHTAPIRSIAVHPSGRLLLSVSSDSFLRLWDLTKGNCAYTLHLKAEGQRVAWSSSGDAYVILYFNYLEIYSTATGEVTGTVKGVGKLNTVVFAIVEDDGEPREAVITGGEDRSIRVWSRTGESIFAWATGHGARVKDLSLFPLPDKRTTAIVSISTDGGVKVWDLDGLFSTFRSKSGTSAEKLPTPDPLTTYEAKCRLTCVIATGISSKRKERESKSSEGRSSDILTQTDDEDVESGREELAGRPRAKLTITFEGDDATNVSTSTAQTSSHASEHSSKTSHRQKPYKFKGVPTKKIPLDKAVPSSPNQVISKRKAIDEPTKPGMKRSAFEPALPTAKPTKSALKSRPTTSSESNPKIAASTTSTNLNVQAKSKVPKTKPSAKKVRIKKGGWIVKKKEV